MKRKSTFLTKVFYPKKVYLDKVKNFEKDYDLPDNFSMAFSNNYAQVKQKRSLRKS